MAVDNGKLFMSGAIAGAVTPYILSWVVMPILNFFGGFVPSFSLKLADPTVAINVRESLTGINASLAGWITNAFGITIAESALTMIAMSAVGGGLLFVAGGYVADMLGFLKGNAMEKTRNTIFAGSALAAVLLGTIGLPPELGITFVNVLIAMLVNAAILAWVYSAVDNKAKLGLVPF
jgi:hypothetical protein